MKNLRVAVLLLLGCVLMAAGCAKRVAKCTTPEDNPQHHYSRGMELLEQGKAGEAEEHFKDAMKAKVDERRLIYYDGKEAAPYFMGVAYLEAREFQKARDKFSEVLNMKREGKWNEKADKGWKKVDKIVRATGGITLGDVGKEIAMRESVNRGDMAALLADELKIEKLFAGRIPIKSEIDKLKAEFTPADVLNHHFKEEVLTMMKWGARGLEPQYDQTTKAYLFKPDEALRTSHHGAAGPAELLSGRVRLPALRAYFGQER